MFHSFKKFQKVYCAYCVNYRKLPYCDPSEMPADCPWKGETVPVHWPGDESMKICPCCGRDVYVPLYRKYIYRSQHHTSTNKVATEYYCGWNCMRREEKIIEKLCKELKLPCY